ncbi:hypothetical protein [uncultured Porticoccus sp.]|uniref:hypothetical protein n=1 Tax=uncultured Porticoccus sp. TaxID=1256050 RepID=UPI002615D4A4|nr:hypothetical protein [uncultured Porticoccus sp.]
MNKNVLVAEANALGMIAVIRSLGEAGYRIFAIAPTPDALGFYSTFTSSYECHPSYTDSEFVPWLRSYIECNDIQMIVPSEGFLQAINAAYGEFSPLLPDAVDVEVVSTCLSKVATQARLKARLPELDWHIPVGGAVSSEAELGQLAIDDSMGTGPFFVKADAEKAKSNTGSKVIFCKDIHALHHHIRQLLPDYHSLLWQEYVPGKKVGVSLWRHQGEFMAESMVLGVHMQPWTGGMMSLRESFWHEAILADARKKMEILGWQGVAMMEYKWEPETDRFWFIEINARFWGYLHLDLYSGKNYPRLQTDAFFGHAVKNLGPPNRKVVCRHTVPGEIGYLLSRLRSRQPAIWQKWRSVAGFFCRFLDFRIKSDLWYPGDRMLYVRSWVAYFKSMFSKKN